MRIARASILIAVLLLAAVVRVRASPWLESAEGGYSSSYSSSYSSGSSSVRHSRHAAHRQQQQESWQDDWMSPRKMQALLRREGGEEGRSVDCCPSVMEMVQPKGGKNQEGMYVELYVGNNPNNETQRFYEFSCRDDVVNKPCRFVDRKLRNQSRCEQKYAFQYAIVRADDGSGGGGGGSTFFPNGTSGWKLDYILVRSGCSCVVMPKAHSRKKAGGGSSSGTGTGSASGRTGGGGRARYQSHSSRERTGVGSPDASGAVSRLDTLMDDDDNIT